jgi:2-methylisocitrate lyase-like PEP mutase family enzyme
MNVRERMRRLLAGENYIVTPGVANPMQAIILEKAGFDYIYMTGSGTSITQFGLVDIGLLTETEMVNNARNIAKAVKIPVLADADDGYGNAINVIRTVENYEAAGVAGIHIEDQEAPKRCGHFAGKMIIPIEEAVGKIKAAVDAKEDKNFIVIARTDAISAVGGGFDEALKRGKAYAQAGADSVFCEFTSQDIEEPIKFAEEMHKEFPNLPLFFNYSSNFKWYDSPLTFDDIAKIGYKIIIVSKGCIRVSKHAVSEYAADLMARKEQAVKDFQKKETENLAQFGGLSKFKELEEKYLPREEVRNKYKKTVGL